MIKLAFLVRSLERGGSERQLVTLARALDKRIFEVTIFTFYGGGPLERELDGAGVRLVPLGKRGRWDLPGFLLRLARELRALRPDVVHGYLDIANLLALAAKPVLPSGASVVWGARSSDIDLARYDWPRRAGFRLERRLARFADRVIVNSHAGRAHLAAHGFPPEKLVVIQNGIDTERFRPDCAARARVRAEWGVAEGSILVGLVARLDPVKDHATFLRAASFAGARRPDARFVCVGGGAEGYRRQLEELSGRLGLAQKIRWAGVRADMPAVYNAFDVNVSSSLSEGFPNAVAEAMACGVPCVVTDAGDSAALVGDAKFVSAPGDAGALAANLLSIIASDRRELGARARLRVESRWGVGRLAERTAGVIAALGRK